MKKNIWYAVIPAYEDNPDWGWGSTRKRDAIRMARQWTRDEGRAYDVAVIDTATDDHFCTAVIEVGSKAE